MGQLRQCSWHAVAWQSLKLSPAVAHVKEEELGDPQAADPSRCFGGNDTEECGECCLLWKELKPLPKKNDMLSGANRTEKN